MPYRWPRSVRSPGERTQPYTPRNPFIARRRIRPPAGDGPRRRRAGAPGGGGRRVETARVDVGAGPAGSMAALAAARGGLRVALVDRKRAVGEPVQCAEGGGRFALESNGLRPDPRVVRQEGPGAGAGVPHG